MRAISASTTVFCCLLSGLAHAQDYIEVAHNPGFSTSVFVASPYEVAREGKSITHIRAWLLFSYHSDTSLQPVAYRFAFRDLRCSAGSFTDLAIKNYSADNEILSSSMVAKSEFPAPGSIEYDAMNVLCYSDMLGYPKYGSIDAALSAANHNYAMSTVFGEK